MDWGQRSDCYCEFSIMKEPINLLRAVLGDQLSKLHSNIKCNSCKNGVAATSNDRCFNDSSTSVLLSRSSRGSEFAATEASSNLYVRIIVMAISS